MGKFKKVGFNFTMVPNSVIDDKEMSWKAKGVYLHLASKPDGWQFSRERIAKAGNGGVDVVRTALKELEELGYLKRKRQKTGRMDYHLYAEPQKKASGGKTHRGKIHRVSKTDCYNKKKGYTKVYPMGGLKKNKPMYEEPQIELDEFGEQLPPREKKTKTPVRTITRIANHYTTLFGVPKDRMYHKYKRTVESMLNLARSYHGDDLKAVEEEVVLRITVAKKYADYKGWGRVKLETIFDNWNEIPKWNKTIE